MGGLEAGGSGGKVVLIPLCHSPQSRSWPPCGDAQRPSADLTAPSLGTSVWLVCESPLFPGSSREEENARRRPRRMLSPWAPVGSEASLTGVRGRRAA